MSIFCARAGAHHVTAIDNATIAEYAKEICKPYSQITVLKQNISELTERKYDIIVCEWMGYFLLYESFIFDIIKARDRLLKPGGLILPDRFAMYVCGLTDTKEFKLEKQSFWRDVYGIDMSCLGKNVLNEP